MLRTDKFDSSSAEACEDDCLQTYNIEKNDLTQNLCEENNSKESGIERDGCIYPDNVIMDNGVSFQVRYTGCLEVKTSMKSLDFQTRTQVARESINRVCEAAGFKGASKRRVDKKIYNYISDKPCLQHAGTNVIINVSSKALKVVNIETGDIILNHNMPRISFASGGDSDTLDFLAYIAKNDDDWRACYVLECDGGQSEDMIVTIGKAFMLRYNALSKKTNYNVGKENEKDYYNDLPNKSPPELKSGNNLSNLVTHSKMKKHHNYLSKNLIDLNSPPPDQFVKMNLPNFECLKEVRSSAAVQDVMDIQPFSLSAEVQRSQLMTESWFHASITRQHSESLLRHDGDFLVRESQGKSGQYVLTGLENKTPKHLLLIDPEGVVRTKDRVFDSISHLINYHWTNLLPIISEETELVLRNPVLRISMVN